MGFNGTFLFVSAERDTAPRVAAAIERFFVAWGASLVSRSPLSVEEWRADRRLFGIAISPPVSGWMAIADTERNPSAELARFVAEELATVSVISSIFEICDPPEPEALLVFGAPMVDRFRGLYERAGFRYGDLARPSEHFAFLEEPPFDASGVVFLTFRGDREREHGDDFAGAGERDDIPF